MDENDTAGLTLSIFERLTDRNPKVTSEPGRSHWSGVGELTMSVMDYLTALLNVKRSDNPTDATFPETNTSVAAFGIPDFSSLTLANPRDRERLRRSVERAIRLFEPRLMRVQVLLMDWKAQDAGLRLRIEGILRAEPVSEPIAFSALLTKDSRTFEVAEARD